MSADTMTQRAPEGNIVVRECGTCCYFRRFASEAGIGECRHPLNDMGTVVGPPVPDGAVCSLWEVIF